MIKTTFSINEWDKIFNTSEENYELRKLEIIKENMAQI